MSKSDHLAGRLAALEEDYRSKLVGALRECASGKWGLFGHNDHLTPKAPVLSAVEELAELGRDIETIRTRLGLEPFPLHQRFWASRGRASPNAPGEPKQAQSWLAELGEA
jgi:hypothetical protein